MKRYRMGLALQFQAAILLLLLGAMALIALLWIRQGQSQNEVINIARGSTHALLTEQVRVTGEAQVKQLAEALTNPMYFFDLDAVGTLARSALRGSDVEYVLVFDANGRVLHDGSGDIATYGQPMSDALARTVVAERALTSHRRGNLLDVSAPISVGDDRLGGVRIGYSLAAMNRSEDQALAELRTQFGKVNQKSLTWLLLSAALALLALAAAATLQSRLVRPIKLLVDAAQRIEAGDYTSPVPASKRNDELGDLVRTFARMRDSVSRHDREIRRMAYSDALTGLSNRLAFRESLEQRMRALKGAGQSLALLFADLDEFKRINDTFGHEAGDDVLLQVAGRIASAVTAAGGGDSLVARFGGDEFVVLVQAEDAQVDADVHALASQLAEILLREMAEPFELQGRQVLLGTSIGVALFPEDADSASLLMKNGDIAMYQAKSAGKNCYRFYSREMDEASERRVHMEQDLRGAWDRDELQVVYQPIVRTSDRVLLGAEALLRWNHPVQGPIAPTQFIDIAEQSGLIGEIGAHVLNEACRVAAQWTPSPGADSAPFIAVNVSARQLRTGDLLQQVQDALSTHGLAPERLHLELTETAVLSDEFDVSVLLASLRQLGTRIWLDDFGTGYSSLSHLRRVPVDGLKIDQSFIADLLDDPDDLALTNAIVAMAHSMGLTVVAEGVEQEAQLDLLRARGCDMVQGFLMARPLAMFEFNRLLG